MANKPLFLALCVATSLAWPAPSALADAIDGNWCFKNGKTMSIDGPQIVTPGGTKMQGDYDRHGFAYTVPKSEPGAGGKVSMILVDEDTVHLTIQNSAGSAAKSPMQVWRRCDLTT